MFYKLIMVLMAFMFILGCKEQENKYADSPVGACFVTKDNCRVGYSVEATLCMAVKTSYERHQRIRVLLSSSCIPL